MLRLSGSLKKGAGGIRAFFALMGVAGPQSRPKDRRCVSIRARRYHSDSSRNDKKKSLPGVVRNAKPLLTTRRRGLVAAEGSWEVPGRFDKVGA